jgi:hypothetical protein
MTTAQRLTMAAAFLLACGCADLRPLHAQLGFDAIPASALASQAGAGFGGARSFYPSGYGVRNGQVGAGYQSAGRIYRNAWGSQRQTTISLGPLSSAIASVPGWYGSSSSHRIKAADRRRF